MSTTLLSWQPVGSLLQIEGTAIMPGVFTGLDHIPTEFQQKVIQEAHRQLQSKPPICAGHGMGNGETANIGIVTHTELAKDGRWLIKGLIWDDQAINLIRSGKTKGLSIEAASEVENIKDMQRIANFDLLRVALVSRPACEACIINSAKEVKNLSKEENTKVPAPRETRGKYLGAKNLGTPIETISPYKEGPPPGVNIDQEGPQTAPQETTVSPLGTPKKQEPNVVPRSKGADEAARTMHITENKDTEGGPAKAGEDEEEEEEEDEDKKRLPLDKAGMSVEQNRTPSPPVMHEAAPQPPFARQTTVPHPEQGGVGAVSHTLMTPKNYSIDTEALMTAYGEGLGRTRIPKDQIEVLKGTILLAFTPAGNSETTLDGLWNAEANPWKKRFEEKEIDDLEGKLKTKDKSFCATKALSGVEGYTSKKLVLTKMLEAYNLANTTQISLTAIDTDNVKSKVDKIAIEMLGKPLDEVLRNPLNVGGK